MTEKYIEKINVSNEDLLLKASDFTTAGKTLASSFSLPSGRYEVLTLGSSGDSYTAPGNGYYYIYIPAGSSGNNQLVYIENVGKPCVNHSTRYIDRYCLYFACFIGRYG